MEDFSTDELMPSLDSVDVSRDSSIQASQVGSQEQDFTAGEYAADIGLGMARGVIGFGQSLYDLADFLAFDVLDDRDFNDELGMAETRTWAGGMSEGITQFLTGFLPVAGGLGWAAKGATLAKAGKSASYLDKAFAAGRMDKFGKMSKTITGRSKMQLNWKGDMTAGFVSDYISFGGQEERLSNLINGTSLQNPVTEFLAADPDDNELIGRLKNSIEGALMEVGVGVLMKNGFMKSLDVMKKGRSELKAGEDVDIEDLQSVMTELGSEGKAATESTIYKKTVPTTASQAEATKFKSNVWEPEQLEGGQLSKPFTPLRDKANQEINPSRGVDKIMDRLNMEAMKPDVNISRGDVDMINDFFKLVGDEPFSDVALSFSKRMGNTALMDFHKGVAEIGTGIVERGEMPEVFFHEMWHAASRSLGDKDVEVARKAYMKGRKSYEKDNPIFRDASVSTKNFTSNITGSARKRLVDKYGEAEFNKHFIKKKGVQDTYEFRFTRDNYRFSNVDEWFAEQMKDATLGRLSKESAPSGTVAKMIEGISEYAKAIFSKLKAKLGFDPTEDFLNRFEKRQLGALKTNEDLQGAYGSTRYAKDLRSQAEKSKAASDAGAEAAKYSTLSKNHKARKLGQKLTEGEVKGGRQLNEIKPHKEVTTFDAFANGYIRTINKELMAKATLSMDEIAEGTGTMFEAWINDLKKSDGKDISDIVDEWGRVNLKDGSVEDHVRFTFAIRNLQDVFNLQTMKAIKEYKKLPDKEGDEAMQMLAAIKANTVEVANLEAKNSELVASKAGTMLKSQDRDAARSFSNINVDLEELAKSTTKRNEFLNNSNFTDKKVQDLIKLVEQFGEGALKDPSTLSKVLNPPIWSKISDGIYTYWVNSLLSGSKTFAANFTGAAAHHQLRSLYLRAGMSLDKSMRDDQFLKIYNDTIAKMQDDSRFMLKFRDVVDSGWRTFKEGVSDFEGAGQRGVTDKSYDQLGGWFMSKVKIPTRGLLGADAMMKQKMYGKAFIRQSINRQIYEKGLTNPSQISEAVRSEFMASLTDSGRLANKFNLQKEAELKLRSEGKWDQMEPFEQLDVKNRAAKKAVDAQNFAGKTQKLAIEDANKSLFMGDAPVHKKINPETGKEETVKSVAKQWQDWTAQAPFGLRWILPFTRTPINVINEGMALAFAPVRAAAGVTKPLIPKDGAIASIHNKLLGELGSDNALVRAEAKGRAAAGTAMWGTVVATLQANPDMITGGGPTDPAQRKRLEETGWQKYSIKVGNTYYSYQRMDPIAMILGLAADVNYQTSDPAKDIDTSATAYAGMAMTVLSNNVLDKSFLVGIDSLLDALGDENKMAGWVKNMGASFVPTAIPQAYEMTTGSPVSAEAWDFLEGMQRRAAIGAGGLDPKRNILGEEIDEIQYADLSKRGFDFVANVSEDQDDVVLEEIASLRQGFDLPSKIVGAGVDLTQFKSPSGRSAYDYYRKSHSDVIIGGRTLRQELERTIKSNWYQKIDPTSYPNFQSQRISELRKVIRKYKNLALEKTMAEFPEVRHRYNMSMEIKNQSRRGVDVYDQIKELNDIF